MARFTRLVQIQLFRRGTEYNLTQTRECGCSHLSPSCPPAGIFKNNHKKLFRRRRDRMSEEFRKIIEGI